VTRSAMTAAEMAERIRARFYDTPDHARRALRRQRGFSLEQKRELAGLIDVWTAELGVYA
jgi:hypothetical protein